MHCAEMADKLIEAIDRAMGAEIEFRAVRIGGAFKMDEDSGASQ
jgi:hypothetical protein